MDTSEQYIKMCQKAYEIQEMWKPRWGDFVDDVQHINAPAPLMTVRFKKSGFIDTFDKEDCIWLPRQEQLQELSGLAWRKFDEECHDTYMIKRRLKTPSEIICSPITIISEKDWDKLTKEQIGLEVVMKEKFEKVWNGEDWVNNVTTSGA